MECKKSEWCQIQGYSNFVRSIEREHEQGKLTPHTPVETITTTK